MKMVPNSKDLLAEKVHNSLRAFNEHARDCFYCKDPYAVHLSETRTLCDTGHGLAQTIADYLYSKARNSPAGQIEVTFPEGWESVDGLIRSITHQLQGKPSNWIDYAAIKPPVAAARPPTTATVAREAGMYIYVTDDYYRGSSYESDISRRVEPGVQRSSSGHRRHHTSNPRSSNLNLSAQMLPSPPSSPSSSASSHHHHHHHHHPHHSHHSHHSHHRSPRSSTSNTSSTRVVSFNPEVQTRYI